MRISNKKQMQKLLSAGVLGPTFPVFNSLAEAAMVSKRVGARCRYKGGPCFPVNSVRNVIRWLMQQYLRLGMRERDFYYTAGIPTTAPRLNAELGCPLGVCTLHYSTLQAPMRPALALDGRHKYGSAVWMFLHQKLSAVDYEAVRELYDVYADEHVIEFTVWDSRLVIWEIRAY